ncbi:creatininase family protein [Herbiconiux sp. A18JL235]|uniref:Creatininase family protein n=1 Tax=Herbiconiux sp. A18JL235 TaxID=3152363 RepID=A0AB39BHC7_9MICO
MTTTRHLAQHTTTEAGELFAQARLALLPVGAIEQHGPHLELRTDISIATAMAERIAAGLGEPAIVCPPMPYGISEHHLRFAGTLTLRPATFQAVVVDIVESLAAHGVDRILVVNGHGGNVDAVRLAARAVRRDVDIMVAHMMWATVIGDIIAEEMEGRGAHNHACEIETSLALALCPQIVRYDRPGPAVYPGLEPLVAPPTARFDVPLRFDELSSDGALGDPSRADLELGSRLADAAVERGIAFARAFLLEGFPQTQKL